MLCQVVLIKHGTRLASIIAPLACIRRFSGVKTFVILKRAGIAEFLSAVTTHVLGLFMHSHVKPELRFGAEFRVASFAVDFLLTVKSPHVTSHRIQRQQNFPAFRARIFIDDSFMNFSDMRVQRALDVELAIALVAFMH